MSELLMNNESQSYDLDIYNKKFIVLQFLSKYIEMYQVKTFYYQSIQGIREFRYSMSQQKSYLYYPNSRKRNLHDTLAEGLSRKELYRIIEQIKSIIDHGESYLLYTWAFILNSQWILVEKQEEFIRLELLYVPMKEIEEAQSFMTQKVGYERSFLQQLATAFNQVNDMDAYYYFMRTLDTGKSRIDIYQCIKTFLERKESQWLKEK